MDGGRLRELFNDGHWRTIEVMAYIIQQHLPKSMANVIVDLSEVATAAKVWGLEIGPELAQDLMTWQLAAVIKEFRRILPGLCRRGKFAAATIRGFAVYRVPPSR